MSLTLQVADYFKAHPNEWINLEVLMPLGGRYAVRTRISDCRLHLGMTIANKVTRDARGVATSYYRYEPPLRQAALFEQGAA